MRTQSYPVPTPTFFFGINKSQNSLLSYADPDPVFHFDADLDPVPAFTTMRIRILFFA